MVILSNTAHGGQAEELFYLGPHGREWHFTCRFGKIPGTCEGGDPEENKLGVMRNKSLKEEGAS